MPLEPGNRQQFNIAVDQQSLSHFLSLAGARLVMVANGAQTKMHIGGKPATLATLRVSINSAEVHTMARFLGDGDVIIVAASPKDGAKAWWGPTLLFALVRDDEGSWDVWRTVFWGGDREMDILSLAGLAHAGVLLFS